MPKSRISKLLAGVSLAAFAGPLPAAAEGGVGVVTLANPDTYTQPPGGAEAVAAMGDPVVMNQRFRTDDQGQAHLLFEDKSSITIGPNSEMTIDQFVYNPEGGLGSAVLSTTTGVFRFVGGQISKDQEVEVNTSFGTLGIRGAIAAWGQLPSGEYIVFFFYGDFVNIVTENGEVRALQPGTAVLVTPGPNGGFEIQTASPEQIEQLLSLLEGMGPPLDPNAEGLGQGFAGGAGGYQQGIDRQQLYELILELGLLDDGVLTLDELEELVGFPDADNERLREVLEDIYSGGYSGF